MRSSSWYLQIAVALLVVVGCAPSSTQETVVLYTALDQIFSEPILDRFERETGIDVLPVFDTESTKTVGLVNRIIAERSNPQCDVFWNNEIVRTVMLKRRGLLEPYRSPASADIPTEMLDDEGYWTGFAARARILIFNTGLLSKASLPSSILDLTEPPWTDKVALAYPLFGTTATHAAVLFTHLGRARAEEFYMGLKDNGVTIVDGNATSRDVVVRGEVPIGFTDTDDANIALEQGKAVGVFFPDQRDDEMGTLVIPNTVALIKNCPHPEEGKRLIDFLLSRETESALAHSGSAQMPVRSDIPVPEGAMSLSDIKMMEVDWEEVSKNLPEVSSYLESLFVQ